MELTKNENILEYLLIVYKKLNDNRKYFDTYIQIINTSSNIEDKTIFFNDFDEKDLIYVKEYLYIKKDLNKYNAKKYQNLYEKFIKELFQRKKFREIVNLFQCINYKYLNYLNFGFELAYSFGKINMPKLAKEMYEEYLKKYPNSSEVLNNLGVIYENEENYDKAIELYEQSEEILHDKIHLNNIERCKKLIEQNKIEIKNELLGLNLFNEENIWIINKLKLFYSNADEKNNIICSYKKLPVLLKCDAEHAKDLLNTFLKNSYVSKNKNHNYNTLSSVYKVNSKIVNQIKKMENEYEIISKFINNLNEFSINKLCEIDYVKIKKNLEKITDDEIKKIFIRDYDELVFNYLTNQFKTVIILGGSIIELILLYVLEINNVKKYKVGTNQKNKKIKEMDITEMLEVLSKEKIINNAPQKIIDGTKNFRNFIHPGRELREKKLDIDKQTVDLVMTIVRWLFLSMNFNKNI